MVAKSAPGQSYSLARTTFTFTTSVTPEDLAKFIVAATLGQLENTESGNGIRERKRKRTVRAHAHDLNEWAGQPTNGRIETCSIKFVWFHAHCISERD